MAKNKKSNIENTIDDINILSHYFTGKSDVTLIALLLTLPFLFWKFIQLIFYIIIAIIKEFVLMFIDIYKVIKWIILIPKRIANKHKKKEIKEKIINLDINNIDDIELIKIYFKEYKYSLIKDIDDFSIYKKHNSLLLIDKNILLNIDKCYIEYYLSTMKKNNIEEGLIIRKESTKIDVKEINKYNNIKLLYLEDIKKILKSYYDNKKNTY